MSRPEQKVQEKKDFELFRSLSSIQFMSINHDCEKPDCDTQTEVGKVGIEITEFVRSKKNNSKIRSVDDTLLKLGNDVKTEIRTITNQKLIVIYTRQSPLPRKINSIDRRDIIFFLANHIRKKEVFQKLNEDFFRFEFKYSKAENEFIKSVNVSTYPNKETLTVSENKSYFTGVIPQKYIEAIIKEKESKMDFARNKETWLLIVVAEEAYSCGIIDSTVLNYKFDFTIFNRIFMLERFSKKIFELNLSV
jgi:hypothetical protein